MLFFVFRLRYANPTIRTHKTMSDKSHKELENQVIEKMSSAGSYLDKFLGDVSKKSATKQIVIGGVSGW